MSTTSVMPRTPTPRSVPSAPGSASTTGTTKRPTRYFPALDGIRAIAVIAVLLYHFGVPHASGGFLGVDLFFVLSGYLITSQLITRWVYGPSITAQSFVAFWAARARRLFPALGVLLVATSAAAAIGDRGQLSLYRGDLAAAATYTSNWWYVFHHRSYFVAAGRPPLLQHLWSLAVEEQFYLLWPVVILAIVVLVRRRLNRETALFATAVGLMLISAAIMGVGSSLTHVPQLGDPSRWYFGTDSHSMGLLAGAALAALRGGDGLGSRSREPVRAATAWSTALGVAALAGILVALSQVNEYAGWLYRTGFLEFSLAAAVLISVAVQRGPLASLLGRPALVAIGRRSYTIYLWHWPVAAMTRPGIDLPWPAVEVFALRVALTVALTEATYRLVELPVRRMGWRAYWRQITRWRLGRLPGSALLLPLVALLALAVCWPSAAPARPQRAYAAGVTYVRCAVGTDGRLHVPVTAPHGARCANTGATTLAGRLAAGAPAPARTLGPLVGPLPVPSTASASSRTHAAVSTPLASATTTHPAPRPHTTSRPSPTAHATTTHAKSAPSGTGALSHQRLVVYGDSVPLGAIPQLAGIFASVTNNAVEGIQAWTLLPRMIKDGKAGKLNGAVVLLHTGDNGLISADQLNQALHAAARARLVIVATPDVPRTWGAPNVRTIERAVPRCANCVLLDWGKDVKDADHGAGWLYADGVHLTPPGRIAYSTLVARAALTKPAKAASKPTTKATTKATTKSTTKPTVTPTK